MHRLVPHFGVGLLLAGCLTQQALAQKTFTWEQLRDQFEATNPTLRAGEINIAESRAQETTAYLRPNPDFTSTVDQFDPFTANPYRPLTYLLPYVSFSYLHERRDKRELRLESARKATDIAESSQADLERTLLFGLRGGFVQALQAKAVLKLAQDNLAYWDHGRHCGDRSRPSGVAARAIRIRPADRRSELAHGQNPASDAVE